MGGIDMKMVDGEKFVRNSFGQLVREQIPSYDSLEEAMNDVNCKRRIKLCH